KNDPNKKIIYITSEEFTNEVVDAIRTNSTSEMKKRFRTASLFLLDDVQFLSGKERVQEELFHTFNILIDSGAQIVLSSDKPPSEMKKMERRLISRFSGGLTVDIGPLDFELRCAILLIKSKKYDYDLSIDTAKIIAEKTNDARELEGALLRLITETETKGIVQEEAVKTLSLNESVQNSFGGEEVIKNTCAFYNIKATQLKGPRRDARLVRARQVCMYLLKKEVGLTYSEIGNLLGGRDHTTVMHGVSKIEEQLSKKGSLTDELMGITGKNLITNVD
ncbi:MAG: chromosomal replication initiator protein DnaA, partial [Patescibacteria group bacterium]